MTDLNVIINVSELKTSLLKKDPLSFNYDQDFDALRIYFENTTERFVVHYLDDYVAILFSPESKEIIGIQVEAFNKVFIRKHSDLESAWILSRNCEEHNLKNIDDMMFFAQKQYEKINDEVKEIAEFLLFNKNDSHLLVNV